MMNENQEERLVKAIEKIAENIGYFKKINDILYEIEENTQNI